MMVVCDTNHIRELVEDGLLGKRLIARIDGSGADVFTCIVVAEESIRGWFALLNRLKPGHEQLDAYRELKRSIQILAHFDILDFDIEAADHFTRLRKLLPRSGTMDLKIAAICLAHDAILLTRNISDFEHVPGLQIQNWLD
jgi:tRNA(fMet)-specific endonuclease VapC